MLNFIYGVVVGFILCFIWLAIEGKRIRKRKLKNDIENIRLNKMKNLYK